MPLASEFVNVSAAKLEQLCGRIETCAARLTEEQIWARGAESQNAIGNLILHLTGNLRQWILSGIGGAPDKRIRDREFSAREAAPSKELLAGLRAAVNESVATIRGLSADVLMERISVQGYDVTKLEAVYHVVEHFSMHTGQIIFATKLLTGEDMGFYAHLSGGSAHRPKTP
jgi:uncharacterized damage-inducible protein DinB